MFLYADPEACPVCRATITSGTTRCDHCGTALTGTTAQHLFVALTRADELVRQLAALSANATAARTAPSPAPGPGGTFSFFPEDQVAYPAPQQPARPRRGLSAASVPQILLGLGATCLLVAALVFLAVAWSALGVGGRTVVLVALTLFAAGGAWLLARARLRAGAESFMVLALGLLALDVVGSRTSGWLGDIADDLFIFVLGTCLALAGLLGTHLLRTSPVGRLVGSQLIGGFGAAFGAAGLSWSLVGSNDPDRAALAALLWFVMLSLVAWTSHRFRFPVAVVVVLVALAVAWLELLFLGLFRIDLPATLGGVWGGARVWPSVVAALLAAAAALPLPGGRRAPDMLRVLGAAVAIVIMTGLVTLPAIDEGGTTVTLVASVVILAAVVAAALLPLQWRPTVAMPAALGGLALLGCAAVTTTHLLDALLGDELWSLDATSALARPDLPWHLPLLLPVAVLGTLLAAWVVGRQFTDVPLARHAVATALPVAASATLVPAAYGVPLAVEVGLLLLTGAVLALVGLRRRGDVGTVAFTLAALSAGLGVFASFQSQGLTAVSSGLVAAAALATWQLRHPLLRTCGDLVFAPAAALFLWTTLDLVGVDPTWRAIPMLVVVGAWAVLGARPERELMVALVGAVTITVCLAEGSGTAQTWLAVDLTLAGVLAHLSALVNSHRRWMGWVGLALMVAAQWVRLDQLGVETVEAYTLPLAVVLLVVGVLRMRHADIRSPRALGPGLTLALVPSLLVALAEPVSLRAALLGVGCLVVLGAGIALRWSAPLVAGATVGLILVLREATYASVLPQWAMIGTIGVVLTVIGVTWERRLSEVRTAVGYLRRLD